MTTPSRRFALLPAALAGLALAACSSPYGSSSAAAPPATTTTVVGASTPALTKAADLRTALTHVLVEHAYLLAAAIVAHGSDADSALATNSTDLAQLLGQAYGDAFAGQFLTAWNARIQDIEAYAKGIDKRAASARITSDETALATLVHSANKYLPIKTVTNPATGVADELTVDDTAFLTWVDARTGSDTTVYTKLMAAAETMPHTADLLAAGTAKLFSSQYPGTPTGTAANLRATLTSMLVEHVELGTLTFGAIATGQTAGAQRIALDANTAELHSAFASMYDDATATTFTTLWNRLLSGYDAYARSPGQATDSFDVFARDFATFIDHTCAVSLDTKPLIESMQHVIQGAATGASDLFTRVRAAVAQVSPLASALAEGIAIQMPTRYLA